MKKEPVFDFNEQEMDDIFADVNNKWREW